MSDLYDWIKQQVAVGLHVSVRSLKNLSREMDESRPPKLNVGDSVEFDVMIKNNNPFPLDKLEFAIHETDAIEFKESPIVGQVIKLAGGGVIKAATVQGNVRANPDDAKSAWRILDRICRVTIKGQVDLPPIEFHDEEFEVVQIEDA